MKTKASRNWLLLVSACALLASVVITEAQENAENETASNANAAVSTNAQTQASTEAVTTNAIAQSLEPAASEPGVGGIRHNAIVSFGKDVELKREDSAESVVVIGGSATIHGRVRDAVVAIGGDINVDGQVQDSTVAVLGDVNVGKDAKVRDVVSVGGKLAVASGAKVGGEVQEVNFGRWGLPEFNGLKAWFVQCVLKMRPLAPSIGWVWAVWGVSVLIYLLIAAAFPQPVRACVNQLTERPAGTFLIGLLVKFLLPVIFVFLVMTGIGVLVIPLLLAVDFVGMIVARAAFLEFLGINIGRTAGNEALQKPMIGLLVGAAIITGLYMIPVVGFLTLAITGVWGFGAVVTALFGSLRRRPSAPATPVQPGPPGPGPMPSGVAGVPPVMGTPFAATENAQGDSMPPSAGAVPGVPPVQLAPEIALPRVGFWERMGAAFLDIVLVSIVGGMVGGPAFVFFVALAYFAGMWAWKGTTIGGIILKMQVVREDGRPMTFLVAIVRALAAAFSAIVLFLGFFWIGWDDNKQGWHDKIAGTVVVKVPVSMPLVPA